MRIRWAITVAVTLVAASTWAASANATPAAPAQADPLASLAIGPKGLHPAFAPAIHDYVVRCDQGVNPLDVSVAATTGGTVHFAAPVATAPKPSASVHVDVREDQAIV